MNMKKIMLFTIMCGLAAGWIYRTAAADQPKRVIGQTARVGIEEASMELIARVDSGAATTSVHAESVRVGDGMVEFVIVNRDGSQVPLRMPLARTGKVRNSGSIKERIFVEMTLQHGGLSKRVLVNLNDRSKLTYPLLLGRNWLKDDYLVDVSQEPEHPSIVGNARDLPSLASQ